MPCDSTHRLIALREEHDELKQTCSRLRARNRTLFESRHALTQTYLQTLNRHRLDMLYYMDETAALRRTRDALAARCVRYSDEKRECVEAYERLVTTIERQRNGWMTRALAREARDTLTSNRTDSRTALEVSSVRSNVEHQLYRNQVARFLTHRYVKSNPTCGVCRCRQARTRTLTILGCGHWFCTECWSAWVRTRQQHGIEPNCPMCRTGVSELPSALEFQRSQTPSPRSVSSEGT